MELTAQVLDMRGVIAMLASMGGMMGVLGFLRRVFLNRAIAGLDAQTQNDILRIALVVLNVAGVIGLSVWLGAHVDTNLIRSAIIETAFASFGGHIIYSVNQKPPSFRYGVPPASTTMLPASDTSVADSIPSIPSDPTSAPADVAAQA